MSRHLGRKLPQKLRLLLLFTMLAASHFGLAAAAQTQGGARPPAGPSVSAPAQQPKTQQPPQKKTLRERIVAWLKNLTEIRDTIHAYEPEGQIVRGAQITFRWRSDVTPDHYVIRILDPATDEAKWSSPPIPGESRSFTARLDARTLTADTYNWRVEAYSAKGSTTFSNRGEQSFSFLSPAEADKVRKQEAIILRWMRERPRDEHLILLLGAYYAVEEMHAPARDAFAKYLKLSSPESFSLEEVKSQVAARTKEVSARLDSQQNILAGLPAGPARAQKLEEMMRLSLLTFDYDQAMRHLDELVSLSSGKARDDWKIMKTSLAQEWTLWGRIFAEGSAWRETEPAVAGQIPYQVTIQLYLAFSNT
jgi:hypothetical protein